MPIEPELVAGLAEGGHKTASQQRKAVKQAVQHHAALGKAVDTLAEAQALPGFKPFAKLAMEYSDFDAFHKRGEHAPCYRAEHLTGSAY